MIKKKIKKYRAIVYFEDMWNKQHKRTIIISAKKGERAKDVYNRLKSENGVIGIGSFKEIK
jgi:hypothetical protein